MHATLRAALRITQCSAYHGILAPGASLRDRVVPASQEAEAAGLATSPGSPPDRANDASVVIGHEAPDTDATERGPSVRRTRWAALLQRVFGIAALICPRCGRTLRLIAAIEDPGVARAILECMGLPARAPPATGATPRPADTTPSPDPDRAPPFDFDQTPDYDVC